MVLVRHKRNQNGGGEGGGLQWGGGGDTIGSFSVWYPWPKSVKGGGLHEFQSLMCFFGGGRRSLYTGFWWSAGWAVCHGCIVDVMEGGPVWLSGWGNVYNSIGQPNASSMLCTLKVFLNRLRTKDEACRLPLDCFDLGNVFLWVCMGPRQTQHTPTVGGWRFYKLFP